MEFNYQEITVITTATLQQLDRTRLVVLGATVNQRSRSNITTGTIIWGWSCLIHAVIFE